jgi:GTP-binding protein YchF
MKMGLIGYPLVGKTTLFNTLTGSRIPLSKYIASRASPNIGVAKVPDERVSKLAELFKPKKTVFAQFEYVDIPGFAVKEVKESEFLTQLRQVDALGHIVRAFTDSELPHAPGEINPRRDIVSLESELMLADLIIIENRIPRLEKDIMKMKSAELEKELELLTRCKEALEEEKPLRELSFLPEEEAILRGYRFLSQYPMLNIINLGEEELPDCSTYIEKHQLKAFANKPNIAFCQICGKIEMEISQLDQEDAEEFMESYGIDQSLIERIIRTSYELLGLISFFTYQSDEVKAWSITRFSTALKAAGAIHSDIQRGFIRAEVISFADLIKVGSIDEARKQGLLRLEGKEYQVEDGDVITFKFNV